jgi:hypothetical protein
MEAFLQIYLWHHVSFGMCVHGNCVPLVNWFDMKKSALFFFADVQEHLTRSGVMVQSSVLQLRLIEQGNRHSSVGMVHSCFMFCWVAHQHKKKYQYNFCFRIARSPFKKYFTFSKLLFQLQENDIPKPKVHI